MALLGLTLPKEGGDAFGRGLAPLVALGLLPGDPDPGILEVASDFGLVPGGRIEPRATFDVWVGILEGLEPLEEVHSVGGQEHLKRLPTPLPGLMVQFGDENPLGLQVHPLPAAPGKVGVTHPGQEEKLVGHDMFLRLTASLEPLP